jgi:hypothetical protein
MIYGILGTRCQHQEDIRSKARCCKALSIYLFCRCWCSDQHTATQSRMSSNSARKTFYRSSNGSLYPALHRLENRGWIASFWGTSENNRRARYYRLTAAGRKQLLEHTSRWDRLVRAVNQVLRPAEE